VVLNTFPSPFEMDEFIRKVSLYDSWGASGFIVTDPGAIRLIRLLLPDTLIHVSIGSGITNAWDARFYKALGADVIILPYRWGETEVAAAGAASDIGLEVFLFETVQTGKICPGKCIMSSYLKFREWLEIEGKDKVFGSANRGAKECYRVCQTQWTFFSDDAQPVNLKLRRDARLMLEQLPNFIVMGVECFKISGRERPTAMIRDLVRFYRKVLDGIINGSQTGMEVYAEELAHLRVRWSMEKRKRVNTLLDRADSYAEAASGMATR
jgi:putative protease